MAKKSKDSNKTLTAAKPKENSEASNIFNKLFGEIPDSEPSNTLFSYDNPFRRKSIDPAKNTQNVDEENPTNAKVDNTGDASQNHRKRSKQKSDNLDAGSSKKPPKLDLEENPNREATDGLGSNLKKNKRKRDELEREYEAKKYGLVPEEEGNGEKREKVTVGKKRKAVDNPDEMTVSQEEGYDDESKLLRTVFVGNLPLKMKKKALLREFSKFGEVESVRIRSVPTLDSKKPKKVLVMHGEINEAADSVNAYIVFKTEQSAEAALGHNMSVVGGNHIRVDRACPPRKKLKGDSASASLYSNKRTVFVGNLPFDVKDEELYQLFCGIKQLESNVEAVRVIRDSKTSIGKGIAYVLFKTREAANFVCQKRNLKLRDRELRVCHAKLNTQSTTPSKRKTPFHREPESTPLKKTPESRYKVNTKGDSSYQGLRATKSGEKKKTPSRMPTPVPFMSGNKSREKVKQQKEKRPAVAARKAKANAFKAVGITNQAGNKRKMDARTPQSYNQKKKSKKI